MNSETGFLFHKLNVTRACAQCVTLDSEDFLMQVSFSFLTNLLRVIKNMLESPEGDGPTLLELLSTASIADVHTHARHTHNTDMHVWPL